MTTNEKIIPLLCLVVGLVGGFAFGFSIEKPSTDKSLSNYQEFIKERVASMGVLPPQMGEVKQLFGSITAINGQTITVDLQHPRDLFGDPAMDERSITVDNNTKITLLTQKGSAVFQKEMSEFQRRMTDVQKQGAIFSGTPSEMANRAAPELFDKKDADISALQVGQAISITTAENVKNQKSFVAATIEVSRMTATPMPGNAGSNNEERP